MVRCGLLCAYSLFATPYSLGSFMKARIRITLKNGVLDPQGKAIQHALAALGIPGVEDVRQGKYIEVELGRERERPRRAKRSSACARTCSPTP